MKPWNRWTRTLRLAAALGLSAGCGGEGTVAPVRYDDEARRLAIRDMERAYHADFPDVPEWTVAVVLERVDSDSPPILVDARHPNEIAVSRIPGALTRKEFEARAEEFRERPIVAYCTIGYRSSRYARSLRKQGFDAHNLRGSILAWLHDGGEVVDADGNPVRRVHVYGSRWDLAPEGYETVK